jgi:hypothetical protein
MTSEEKLEEIADIIRVFDRDCAAQEYTDTGDVWQILNDILEIATEQRTLNNC